MESFEGIVGNDTIETLGWVYRLVITEGTIGLTLGTKIVLEMKRVTKRGGVIQLPKNNSQSLDVKLNFYWQCNILSISVKTKFLL